ncbi:hypothetical protein BH09BAC3_BH09BAC3_05410 [soil metagenome]
MKLKLSTKPFLVALVSITLLAAITQLTSCGSNDPAPTTQDQVKAKLVSGVWKIQSVTVDGVDKTSVYPGLTLQFTATTYSSSNGKPVWATSGTWEFTSSDATTIKRDDNIEVTVQATDTSLKLTLNWPTGTLGGGRVGSVKGVNIFTFTK